MLVGAADISAAEELMLNRSVPFPVVINGKSAGSISLPRGSKVELISTNGDQVEVRYKGTTAKIPAASTNVNELTEKKIAEEKAAAEAQSQAEQFKKQTETHQAYLRAKTSIERFTKNSKNFTENDQRVAQLIIQNAEHFVKVYEADPNNAQEATKAYYDRQIAIVREKPVIGYSYNEILKKNVEVPVEFNIFEKTDDVYLKVGDGQFSTAAIMNPAEMLRFVESFSRVDEWITQCMNEKMNAQKQVGNFGGVSLEFFSADNADNIYFLLTVRGPFTTESMIEEQNVVLTDLNWRSLYGKMTKFSSMLDARGERKRNADKLR